MQRYTPESSGAFVSTFQLRTVLSGRLAPFTFGVKDNIDVAGYKTSYGSPAWQAAHPSAVRHAICVEQLLNAGATCIGKTISDEFTYSLDGESYFYGTPLNPKAPDRIPGGSSSGSASAVACGVIDLGLGTDSAGSTRVPASHCGILGMRFTTHRISKAGILPFAPSSSAVGLFANRLQPLAEAAKILLGSDFSSVPTVKNIYLLQDAFMVADATIRQVLAEKIAYLKSLPGITVTAINFADVIGQAMDLLACNQQVFSPLQSAEIWSAIGSWVDSNERELSPCIQNRFAVVKSVDRFLLNQAIQLGENIFTKISEFTRAGDIFCFPTVPMIPPLKGELDDGQKATDYYKRTMAITSFSSVGQLPEISLPLATLDNVPVGLSLAAGHRQDEFLLSAVKQLFPQANFCRD